MLPTCRLMQLRSGAGAVLQQTKVEAPWVAVDCTSLSIGTTATTLMTEPGGTLVTAGEPVMGTRAEPVVARLRSEVVEEVAVGGQADQKPGGIPARLRSSPCSIERSEGRNRSDATVLEAAEEARVGSCSSCVAAPARSVE